MSQQQVIDRTIDALNEQSMAQVRALGEFFDWLNQPTPAQIWLGQAAAQIRKWKEEDAERGEPWGEDE